MMRKKIVVIGSSNVDMIMKMDRLPREGETVTGATFFQVFGGKGANQAVAAARAGGEVIFLTAVGNDPYSKQMLENFRNDGIDTHHILKERDEVSGHALIMIGNAGQNYISVAPGANACLTPEKIKKVEAVIGDAAIIVMQYEIPKETIAYVLDYAEDKGIPVL
ncbi:MAG TPA: PfkB family carbohydrate kinase, partial [Eudoraea sp.]|nr:PfkB family carbohydrate kinase [Eudoraea sp.]